MFVTLCFQLTIYRRSFFFFFNDTATTEIYTLSLHDALPISTLWRVMEKPVSATDANRKFSKLLRAVREGKDRKSTRLNSSHSQISYAVFCLKKKILVIPTGTHIITITPFVALSP